MLIEFIAETATLAAHKKFISLLTNLEFNEFFIDSHLH